MARPGLDRNVKFRSLCRMLGEPRPHVRGYLELLWEVAYENGDPVIGDAHAVEAAAEYPGTPGKLCDALLRCGGTGRAGFIDPVPGSDGLFQVHDLQDHAPDYVLRRKGHEDERKKDKVCERCGRAYRSADQRSKYCSPACRTASWRDGRVTDCNVTVTYVDGPPTPSPTPSPKRGNEFPLKPPSCSEPDVPAAEPDAESATAVAFELPTTTTDVNPRPGRPQDRGGLDRPPDQAGELDPAGDPVVLWFPIVGGKGGKGPTEWPLRQSKIAEYGESFPGVDVPREARKALQWCRDNPARRKTARGMPAFLSRWFAKVQDSGRTILRMPAHSGKQAIEATLDEIVKESLI